MKHKIIFPLCLLILSGIFFPRATRAQIDIHLKIENNEAVVSLVSDRNVQGVVSNFQFSLTWERTLAPLGILQQPMGPDTYLPVIANDSIMRQGNRFYQVFTAFGLEKLSASGSQWGPGDIVEIARIPISNSPPALQIADDTFTLSQNGEFYLELDGEDVTGNIQNIPLTLVPYGPTTYISNIRVFPNPAADVVHTRFNVQHRIPVRWQLFNQEARKVVAGSVQAEVGQNQFSVELTNFPSGVYLLYIENSTFAITKKLVKK